MAGVKAGWMCYTPRRGRIPGGDLKIWALTASVVGVFLLGMGYGDGSMALPLTLIHTNDLHSHLLGFGPNEDYSPQRPGDDDTMGGWARIAAVIRDVRKERAGPVLVMDAGDFLMGSLFHTVSRREGGELRLLAAMGYDVVTLGNHEFDLKPEGLAAILRSAASKGPVPAIVAANVSFDPKDPRDDALEEAFRRLHVRPYRIFQMGGLRVGVFGLMGREAANVAPFARPVRFQDPVKRAQEVVQLLREREGVQLVICLSHSGLSGRDKGEDVELARKVPGIDVIVGGHTHTLLPEPLRVGGAWIVQAGSQGRYLGVLDLEVDSDGAELKQYEIVPIDDRILGDAEIRVRIDGLRSKVEEEFLAPRGLRFYEELARLPFPLERNPWGGSNLGDLVTDAIRWAVDRVQEDRTVVGVESNGLLRDALLPGRRGIVALCDLFRAFPLGFGPDGEMGYPLVSFYLTGGEIREALEILTTVAPLKGSDYVLQISGIRFSYNPYRLPFDRVVDVWIDQEDGMWSPLDTSGDNPRLYKVVANLYNATFLKIIGGFTHGILSIVPKDRRGRPLRYLTEALVDADPHRPGLQELKEWEALVAFVRGLPDTDGDGLPEIPESYRIPQGRILREPTLNPVAWFRHTRWITWVGLGIPLTFLLGLGLLVRSVFRLRGSGGRNDFAREGEILDRRDQSPGRSES